MKFTILSHAGMLAESGGKEDVSIVIDPWLVGSCYWRSWFNFPEPDRRLIRDLNPDYIYLTHLHWDHFHGPSLRRFDPQTPVLVPQIPSPRMVQDLADLGFTDIREIPHGQGMQLAPDFHVHSFQFGPFTTDSAVVLQDSDTTLLNANDCKIFGASLRQITRRFPRIDFVLRSHSSANPLPYCVEGYDMETDDFRSKEAYAREFAAFARAVGARYAIPFASNHCFVHQETRQFNDTAVLPNLVAAYMSPPPTLGAEPAAGPDCVVMAPGSSWCPEAGFQLREFDYSRQADYVESLTQRYSGRLATQYRREAAAKGHFPRFEQWANDFLSAIGWPMRRLLPTIVFAVTEAAGERYWLIDPVAQRVSEQSDAAAGQIVITVPALVINDCVRKRMFSVWTPSKRLRIRLSGAPLWKVGLFLQLLDLYDNQELPLWRFFKWRSLSIWRRRWREPISIAGALIGLKVTRRVRDVASLYAD